MSSSASLPPPLPPAPPAAERRPPLIGLRRAWGWWWQLSWPSLRLQWGRQLAALLTIALGLALAGAVHWINASALAQFESAARQSSAQADLELTAAPGAASIGDALYAELAARDDVAALAPRLDASVRVQSRDGEWLRVRLVGLDLLQLGAFHPQWLPRATGADVLRALREPAVLVSDAAWLRLAAAGPDAAGGHASGASASRSTSAVTSTSTSASPWDHAAPGAASLASGPDPAPSPTTTAASASSTSPLTVRLDLPGLARPLPVVGRIPDRDQPLIVMDIAWAQQLLNRPGQLDAILLRMTPGRAAPAVWPAGVQAQSPADQARQQADEARRITRAYRLNLGVLSLMALFVGAFMVFAVHSLSVAQRLPQLALLGVLGMSARQRLALLVSEALLLGLAGAVLGLVLALGLAELGLRALGGDLGAGLTGLHGHRPALETSTASILGLLALGPLVSLGAAALPLARLRRLPVAQVLKGLGSGAPDGRWHLLGPALLVAAPFLAEFRPVLGISWGAYAAMLALLLGALGTVPLALRALTGLLRGWAARRALPLLAVERARDQAGEAGRLIAGVLVALALAVAMLVMVASFRLSLDQWLTDMLPADLYVRQTARDSTQQGQPMPPAWAASAASLPGVERVSPQRTRNVGITVRGMTGAATLLARPLDHRLPLQGEAATLSDGLPPVFINEAMSDALRLKPGDRFMLRLDGRQIPVGVKAVWRDYSRQSAAVLIERDLWRRLSGDGAITELALWLRPGTDPVEAQAALRAMTGAPDALEIASAGELRRFSLDIFDRSFAITYWLQAVGLGLGLFGVAASLSAQLLARRREFGLLLHLGLTRGMLRRLVIAESLLQAVAGALMGTVVGLAISAVLVFRLNPQSFHWSMDWQVPVWRVLALLAASLAATGITAAWASARALRAGQGEALRAVREDW
ncbi:MAG: ABC transporter permease [Mitsuaria chitosanitabida]|uniref:FtsX-like permease family protein n=1 Tax=Roseateles chitosanitabidus TaxID=65048 RepID=UPI001B1B09E9|nr:ABC transporter permease [Roseateles chitosanitabidus]MBO9685725.1 ABC transporter permease [Roseateles chitosanitabidus]